MLELALLGPLVLRRAGQVLPLAIKKPQALLVLLALQPRGAALPRSRAVVLLWPLLDESSGRRNLCRELARLRDVGGPDVVHADGDFLALAPGLQCDVQRFQVELAAGQPDAALARWRGLPADGLALDDAAAFNDWWAPERERLLAASGRRKAALAQYARCAALLRSEPGLAPMARTGALAASLRGTDTALDPAQVRAGAPPCPVDNPTAGAHGAPLLPEQLPFVGREAEVAALEMAWRAGRCVLIEAEGGVGKSRLATDFAAAHGPHAVVCTRASDSAVPYAAFTRALRALAGPVPDLGDLPRWAQQELARLLPEWGGGEAPPPLQSAAERNRFFEACTMAWLALTVESFDGREALHLASELGDDCMTAAVLMPLAIALSTHDPGAEATTLLDAHWPAVERLDDPEPTNFIEHGVVLDNLGRPLEARASHRRGIELALLHKQHSEFVMGSKNLAVNHIDTGELETAMALLDAAERERRAHDALQGINHLSWNLQAMALRDRGRYAESLERFDVAIAVTAEQLPARLPLDRLHRAWLWAWIGQWARSAEPGGPRRLRRAAGLGACARAAAEGASGAVAGLAARRSARARSLRRGRQCAAHRARLHPDRCRTGERFAVNSGRGGVARLGPRAA